MNPTPQQSTEKIEKVFQIYTSSLENQKLITRTGRILIVRNYKYLTDEQDIIDFLDSEIKAGGFITMKKAGQTTEDDLDPIAALKKRAVQEYIEEQKVAEELKKQEAQIPTLTKDVKAPSSLEEETTTEREPPVNVGVTNSISPSTPLNPLATDRL